jgi:hypothetical protein
MQLYSKVDGMAKKQVKILAGDIGNAWEKFSTFERSEAFPHALQEIPLSDYQASLKTGEPMPSVFVVNGIPYEVGAQAERKGVEKYHGNARYVPEYYGAIAAIGAFSVFEDDKADIFYFGSYPPKDRDYIENIQESVKGRWTVINQGVKKQFNFVDARAFSEPVSAYRHAVLDFDGVHFRGDRALRKGETLVIDPGGFTTDLTVFVDGIPDRDSGRSYTRGIIDVIEDLESALRGMYKSELQGVNRLHRQKLQEALITNKYRLGGKSPLNCKVQVNECFNAYMNEVVKMVGRYEGLGSFDSILLCNGGGAAIEARFREWADHDSVFVSEQERKNMMYSTAWGLLKQARVLQVQGKL